MTIYFDNNATTPVGAEVVEAMMPGLRGEWGNASSIHQLGQSAKRALEGAREQVAEWIGAQAGEIVFTSGGTESDNLAIRGVVGEAVGWGSGHTRPHLVTTQIEHHAVLNVFEELERAGHAVTYVRPDGEGRVSADAIAGALRGDTALVSVMWANNETGVVQPIREIAGVCRAARVGLHVDGIQGAGRMEVDVEKLGCNLLSLSGHKIHAAQGVGALYVRRGTRIRAMQAGGGHERERRAGTENLPGIVGMGVAAEIMAREGAEHAARMKTMRDGMERAIVAAIADCGVVGAGAERVGNTSNIYFDDVEGEALVIALDLLGFCVSTGAACSSGAIEPSHVLLAMGYSRQRARSCVRISLGRQNTQAEVDALVAALPQVVARLRRLSVGLGRGGQAKVRTA